MSNCRVEVLTSSGSHVKVAFYYEVPEDVREEGARDPDRRPAGSALTYQEIQDLKEGRLYEVIKTLRFKQGLARMQIINLLEIEWKNGRDEALKNYSVNFKFNAIKGVHWNGITWNKGEGS